MIEKSAVFIVSDNQQRGILRFIEPRSGGEENNGDNLLAIHDRDIATVFAIEAIMLVDHFNFLDRVAEPTAEKPASKQEAAVMAGWFLSTSDRWAGKYFNSADLHSVDRKLFA